MKLAIVPISTANIYSDLSINCTPIFQLLFGETVEIIGQKKDFYNVRISGGNINGYMLKKQLYTLNSKETKFIESSTKFLTTDSASSIIIHDTSHLLSLGSVLYNFDGWICDFIGQKLPYSGNAIAQNQSLNHQQISNILKKLLNTPFQTGGVSKFGMDAFGLLSMYFRWLNIPIPESSLYLYENGKSIPLLKNALPGDIVFLGNKNPEHFGILLSTNSILHISGCVRIDKFDYLGIYSPDETSYQYKKILKIIRPTQ